LDECIISSKGNLVMLDEKRIIVGENIEYIQILKKHQKDDEK
jgi:hypothetical protein